MENATAMGVLQRLCDRGHQTSSFLSGKPIMATTLERSTFHETHCQEMGTLVFTKLVDGHYVRVVQARCGGRFRVEPVNKLPSGSQAAAQHFQRYYSIHAQLLGFEDDPHSPSANFLK